jgi:hypothetical protein
MLLLFQFVRRRIAGSLAARGGGILTNVTPLRQGFAGLQAAAAAVVVTESWRRIQHEITVTEEGFIAVSAKKFLGSSCIVNIHVETAIGDHGTQWQQDLF